MRRTVLIVDDHPSFRATARLILESDEYEVVGEAADGASALASARDLRPEVVLLDVNLPDGDGFDIAASLTEGGGPLVVLTSSREARHLGLLEESGACGFIPKPELSTAALSAVLPSPRDDSSGPARP